MGGPKCSTYLEKRDGFAGMHAVSITGWGVDESTGLKYWEVANSWGPKWNGDGYFKIERGKNLCGVEDHVCYASPQVNGQSLRRAAQRADPQEHAQEIQAYKSKQDE